MVVFGAGASYDSVPAYRPAKHVGDVDRLPLANQLFESRPEFAKDMRSFPKARPIIGALQAGGDGITIERKLQRLQDEADEYPERYKQLAAVRYYLHVMLKKCEDRWMERAPGGATNQITLLDQIERWRKPNEQQPVKGLVVAENSSAALETAGRLLGSRVRGDFETTNGGFTELIGGREADEFLSG